jgi:UDP-N-acetylglucosamine--N-acetylmuramyl-(pentapeptide) pyrophosphoryl-undecaprenol N-acetylglucosamine transferase
VTEASLLDALVALLRDAPRRAAMAKRARSLAKPGALERIAGMVVGLAK